MYPLSDVAKLCRMPSPNPGNCGKPGSTAENKTDHMFVEIKQYTLEQPVGPKEKSKISWNKQNWKHNISKLNGMQQKQF